MKRFLFLAILTLLFVSCQQNVLDYSERINDLEEENSSLKEENLSLQGEITDLKSQLSDKEDKLSAIQKDLDSKEELKLQLESELELLKSKDEITPLKTQIEELNGQLSAKSDEVLTLQTKITSLDNQISDLKSQKTDLLSEITTLQSKIIEQEQYLTDTVSSLESQIAFLEDQISVKESTLGTYLNKQKAVYDNHWSTFFLFQENPNYVSWSEDTAKQFLIDLMLYSRDTNLQRTVENFVVMTRDNEPAQSSTGLFLLCDGSYYWYSSLPGNITALSELDPAPTLINYSTDLEEINSSWTYNLFGLNQTEIDLATSDITELLQYEGTIQGIRVEIATLQGSLEEAQREKALLTENN